MPLPQSAVDVQLCAALHVMLMQVSDAHSAAADAAEQVQLPPLLQVSPVGQFEFVVQVSCWHAPTTAPLQA